MQKDWDRQVKYNTHNMEKVQHMENQENNFTITFLKNLKKVPYYATSGSVGLDLCASLDAKKENLVGIKPYQRVIIPTGISISLPKEGFEAQVRSRSGLAANYGVCVLNSPGTIDPDYTGEIKVILFNSSNETYFVNDGERIAQLIIAPCIRPKWSFMMNGKEVSIQDDMINSRSVERGSGGLGSTTSLISTEALNLSLDLIPTPQIATFSQPVVLPEWPYDTVDDDDDNDDYDTDDSWDSGEDIDDDV